MILHLRLLVCFDPDTDSLVFECASRACWTVPLCLSFSFFILSVTLLFCPLSLSRRTLLTRLYYPGSRALASPIAVSYHKKSPYHTYMSSMHLPSTPSPHPYTIHRTYIHHHTRIHRLTKKQVSYILTIPPTTLTYPIPASPHLPFFIFVGCWLFRYSSLGPLLSPTVPFAPVVVECGARDRDWGGRGPPCRAFFAFDCLKLEC